ncbi:MAG: hypothetical protein ACXWP5_02135 [Bdellovibrionota bacterium]
MRLKRRAATIWLLTLSIAILAIASGEVRASELSLMLRIQRDYFAPLPLTKNFHPCFKTDARGMQVLAFCAEDDKPTRMPASAPSSKPSSKVRPRK